MCSTFLPATDIIPLRMHSYNTDTYTSYRVRISRRLDIRQCVTRVSASTVTDIIPVRMHSWTTDFTAWIALCPVNTKSCRPKDGLKRIPTRHPHPEDTFLQHRIDHFSVQTVSGFSNVTLCASQCSLNNIQVRHLCSVDQDSQGHSYKTEKKRIVSSQKDALLQCYAAHKVWTWDTVCRQDNRHHLAWDAFLQYKTQNEQFTANTEWVLRSVDAKPCPGQDADWALSRESYWTIRASLFFTSPEQRQWQGTLKCHWPKLKHFFSLVTELITFQFELFQGRDKLFANSALLTQSFSSN